jgi:ABC-type Na+ efflux pump permease subunit
MLISNNFLKYNASENYQQIAPSDNASFVKQPEEEKKGCFDKFNHKFNIDIIKSSGCVFSVFFFLFLLLFLILTQASVNEYLDDKYKTFIN